eukprot:gene6366-1134_t
MRPSGILASLAAAIAAGGTAQEATVFARGEQGYFCIKIPDLIVTHAGTLIAFGEARHRSCSDFTATDLVAKRSSDNGTTWGSLTVVHADTSNATIGNAAPVVLANGRILVPFCKNNAQALLPENFFPDALGHGYGQSLQASVSFSLSILPPRIASCEGKRPELNPGRRRLSPPPLCMALRHPGGPDLLVFIRDTALPPVQSAG